MEMGGRRGSILVHVLVTSVLVALIAASLMRMALFRYTIASRGSEALGSKRMDQAGFNLVMTGWNKNNAVCSAVQDYNCGGAAGVCNCTCDPTAALPGFPRVVAAQDGGGNRSINVFPP